MGLPQQLEQVVKNHLRAHIAWVPISNTYKLGDYGVIANGIFTKMGNITEEFGVSFNSGNGENVSLDFTSDSTTVVNFAGGTEVNVIPEGAIDAKVTFKFNKDRSILIKSPTISVSNINDLRALFNQLKSVSDWRRKYIVIYQTFLAKDAIILTTIDAGTEITFSGNASALKQIKLADASVQYGTNKKLGLELKGKTGIIALGLAKMKFIGGGIDVLTMDQDKEVEFDTLENSNLEEDEL